MGARLRGRVQQAAQQFVALSLVYLL